MAKPVSHQVEKGSRTDCGARGQNTAGAVRMLPELHSGGYHRPTFKMASGVLRAGENPGKDQLLQFTTAAQGGLNGALVRCEERYPDKGHHSVLYVVVDADQEKWEKHLRGLHQQHFGPGQGDPLSPVRLEVVDLATDVALQRLIEAGLLARTSHASRPLFSADGLSCGIVPLSASELEKVSFCRRTAARKLKMARVVIAAGLEEDSRTPLLEALLALGRAFALEQRLPEPALVHEALLPPVSPSWGEALALLREFSIDSEQPCGRVLEALSKFLPEKTLE